MFGGQPAVAWCHDPQPAAIYIYIYWTRSKISSRSDHAKPCGAFVMDLLQADNAARTLLNVMYPQPSLFYASCLVCEPEGHDTNALSVGVCMWANPDYDE